MAYIEDVPKYAFGTAHDIGIGEGKTSEEDFKKQLEHAIKLGVRHIDCAPIYGTQPLVGQVLKNSTFSISRRQFFITSKLPVNMMRPEHIERSIRNSLLDLQLSYLDLFLIHAPFSTKYVADDVIYPLDDEGNILLDEEEDLLEQAWMKLVDLKELGFVKYIGLSNVTIDQLDRLNKIYQVDVVQNEYHLYQQDRELFDHCEEVDVHLEAYAAYGCPSRSKQMNLSTSFTDPIVNRIALKNNLTVPQVVIQWLHQQPLSYVIKTDNIAQLEENLHATQLKNLSINDMIDLDALNRNARLYNFDTYKGITDHREYPFKIKKPLKPVQTEPLSERRLKQV